MKLMQPLSSLLLSSLFLLGAAVASVSASTTVYQAEDADRFQVNVLTRHAGFTGRGYADYQGQGSWIQFNNIEIDLPGRYQIILRYASRNSRKIDLDLNGVKKRTYNIRATNDWTNWFTETRSLSLSKGTHTFRFIARESTGPNIDRIQVKLVEPEDENGDDLGEVIDYLTRTPQPTPQPTPHPTPRPTLRPTTRPTPAPVSPTNDNNEYPPAPRNDYPQATVIGSNSYLQRGTVAYSPSRDYRVQFSNSGDLVLLDRAANVVWSAGVLNAYRAYVQSDGNFLIKDQNKRLLWVAHTSGNAGSTLELDDGGQLKVVDSLGSTLWLAGKPRGVFTGPSSESLQYPIRAAFYYAWYPETWTVNGQPVKFPPTLGKYKSADPLVAESHVDQLDYAHTQLSIASWWGRDRNPRELLDRARLTLLLDTTLAVGSDLKWTIYHEEERYLDQSPAELREDLDYIKKWFAWHPAWGYVDDRPVIFVYNEGGCEVVDRWMDASKGEWYVVLKVFRGYFDCERQPDR